MPSRKLITAHFPDYQPIETDSCLSYRLGGGRICIHTCTYVHAGKA